MTIKRLTERELLDGLDA